MTKVSACTVIKNAMNGYCLFEAMASILPYVDEMIVMDMGSTDGTWEMLKNIAGGNPKIGTYEGRWPWESATELADAQTDVVNSCRYDKILFFQADEVWHEDLAAKLPHILHDLPDLIDVGFWRVQLKENFQVMKWVPHVVHRIGTKESLKFAGNSMNPVGFRTTSSQPLNFPVYPLNQYQDRLNWSREMWEELHPFGFDYSNFILDISKSGAFIDNIPAKSKEHAPLWNEEPNVDGMPIDEWMKIQTKNENWMDERPMFEIPHILKYHVGHPLYIARAELVIALQENNTEKLLELMHD